VEDRRRAYALAAGLAALVSQLLRRVHDIAGGPLSAPRSLPAHRQALRVAATDAYAAAAAGSAVSARLLLLERDAANREMSGVTLPRTLELGVTTLEGSQQRQQRATNRSFQAAAEAVDAAWKAWSTWGGPEAGEIQDLLLQMRDYLNELRGPGESAPTSGQRSK
jgi:hypothetical protein